MRCAAKDTLDPGVQDRASSAQGVRKLEQDGRSRSESGVIRAAAVMPRSRSAAPARPAGPLSLIARRLVQSPASHGRLGSVAQVGVSLFDDGKMTVSVMVHGPRTPEFFVPACVFNSFPVSLHFELFKAVCSQGSSATPRPHVATQAASSLLRSPGGEIELISNDAMHRVSEIKLIRTDTTLDLSQKAQEV